MSSWFNLSPSWNASLYLEYERGYNFSREYQAPVLFSNAEGRWTPLGILEVGALVGAYVEYTPDGPVEEITLNARPYLSLTPVNDLNIRIYVDNLWLRSTSHLEHVLGGLLVSYNFLPKSWIYLAINESQQRGSSDGTLPATMQVEARAAAFKIRYLFYL
jgi:hypothetical protein